MMPYRKRRTAGAEIATLFNRRATRRIFARANVTVWLVCMAICSLGIAKAVVAQSQRSDAPLADASQRRLTLSWQDNILTVHAPHVPGGEIRIWYLEAYCRDKCHDADWSQHTVIGHRTQLVSAAPDGRQLILECHVRDGLVVRHTISAGKDVVDFRIVAHNPTDRRSQAHWAQPCIRVGDFTGFGESDTDDPLAYLAKSFVFIDGKLERLPTKRWATRARYTPGQVWAAPGIAASDVNPRPLNPLRPEPGVIGCFSKDDKWVLAVTFEPYQELFQGVIRCLHSDFRLGGIPAGQTRTVRGRLYIVPNDSNKRGQASFLEK